MLMVIFGAGASHDSIDKEINPRPYRNLDGDEGRPPLAVDLFSAREDYQDLLKRFPKAKLILPEIRYRISRKENIELILQDINDNGKYEVDKAISSIRYYLRALIKETTSKWLQFSNDITNYATLVYHIQNLTAGKKVFLVTFNYDLMLERGLNSIGVSFPEVESYISQDKYLLFKPHGSINWVQQAESRDVAGGWVQQVVTDLDSIILKDTYRIDPTAIPSRGYPVIAIPMINKNEFVCPENHTRSLEVILSDVTHLLIVGWSGTEKHFVDMLKNGLRATKIQVVSANEDSANETIGNLQKLGFDGASISYKPFTGIGFSEYVRTEENLRDFLET